MRRAQLSLLSAALGALIMIGARSLSGRDSALTLASTLGLGSGSILGGLFGGVFAAWLALGGTRRIAATTGVITALAATLGLWRLAQPSTWVVDVVLNEVFGEGGDLYSGLALLLVALPLFRSISGFVKDIVWRTLTRQRA